MIQMQVQCKYEFKEFTLKALDTNVANLSRSDWKIPRLTLGDALGNASFKYENWEEQYVPLHNDFVSNLTAKESVKLKANFWQIHANSSILALSSVAMLGLVVYCVCVKRKCFIKGRRSRDVEKSPRVEFTTAGEELSFKHVDTSNVDDTN